METSQAKLPQKSSNIFSFAKNNNVNFSISKKKLKSKNAAVDISQEVISVAYLTLSFIYQ